MGIKLAVISDIHGNSWALKAVLKDIKERGISHIVNLGDAIYGPLDPGGTAEILFNENIVSISGNQDREIIESLNKENVHFTMKYVMSSINTKTIEWLRSLSKTHVLFEDFFLCHGKPNDDHQYLVENITEQGTFIRSSDELINELLGIPQEIVLCGHSHMPRTIYLSEDKTIINPGSVGLPAYEDDLPYYHVMESGSPHGRYCIISKEESELKIENIAVPYNYKLAAECASRNNRHDWAKELLTGRI